MDLKITSNKTDIFVLESANKQITSIKTVLTNINSLYTL